MNSDETRPAIDEEDDTAAVLAKFSTRSSTRSSTRKKKAAADATTSKSPAAAAPKTAKKASATKRKSAKEEEDKEDDPTDDAEKAPRKKKVAAATHQVQTERDEIPKLWDKEKAAQSGAYSKFRFHPPQQPAPNVQYAIAHFKPSRSLRGMLPASGRCLKILRTYSESLWIGTTWMCYACKKPSCKRVIWRILN
jgi:hypothetical protein